MESQAETMVALMNARVRRDNGTLGNSEFPAHIDHLRTAEKVDVVVVLSHLCFAQDAKLAAEVSGIGAFISGHTHKGVQSTPYKNCLRAPASFAGCGVAA